MKSNASEIAPEYSTPQRPQIDLVLANQPINCQYSELTPIILLSSHVGDTGHQGQTNKWPTRCTEQFHPLAVFAYRAFAAQAAICLRDVGRSSLAGMIACISSAP
jgi:hypothetical protein